MISSTKVKINFFVSTNCFSLHGFWKDKISTCSHFRLSSAMFISIALRALGGWKRWWRLVFELTDWMNASIKNWIWFCASTAVWQLRNVCKYVFYSTANWTFLYTSWSVLKMWCLHRRKQLTKWLISIPSKSLFNQTVGHSELVMFQFSLCEFFAVPSY